MACNAKTSTGAPCGRAVREGEELCGLHKRLAADRESVSIYGIGFDGEDTHALAVAATMDGLDSEIAVLRVLIRKVVGIGDVDAARRCMGELTRMLKARHDLTEREEGQLQGSLDRVLDTLGSELAGEGAGEKGL